MSQEILSSDLRIIIQSEGDLPPGYIKSHLAPLLDLQDKLHFLPEFALLLFNDETTANLDVDDENGVAASIIPAEEGMPLSVRISASELRDPNQRHQFIELIAQEFTDILSKLPHIYLLFQSPHED